MKPRSEAQNRQAEELFRKWHENREEMLRRQTKSAESNKKKRRATEERAAKLRRDFIAKYDKKPTEDTKLWLEFMKEREVGEG